MRHVVAAEALRPSRRRFARSRLPGVPAVSDDEVAPPAAPPRVASWSNRAVRRRDHEGEAPADAEADPSLGREAAGQARPAEPADHLPQQRRAERLLGRAAAPPRRPAPRPPAERDPGRRGGSPRCTRSRARGDRPPRPRSAPAPASGSAGSRSRRAGGRRTGARPAWGPRGAATGPGPERDRPCGRRCTSSCRSIRAAGENGLDSSARAIFSTSDRSTARVPSRATSPPRAAARSRTPSSRAPSRTRTISAGRANPPRLGGEQVGERVRGRSAPGGEERRQAQQGALREGRITQRREPIPELLAEGSHDLARPRGEQELASDADDRPLDGIHRASLPVHSRAAGPWNTPARRCTMPRAGRTQTMRRTPPTGRSSGGRGRRSAVPRGALLLPVPCS